MRLRIIRKFLDVDMLVREEGLESNNGRNIPTDIRMKFDIKTYKSLS